MKKILTVSILSLLFSCVQQKIEDPSPKNNGETIDPNFDFATTKSEQVSLHLLAPDGSPMNGVLVSFYDQSPMTGGKIFLKLLTDANGYASTTYQFPTTLETAVLELSAIGFPTYLKVSKDQMTDGLEVQGVLHTYTELSPELVPGSSVPQDGTYVDEFSSGRIATVYEALGTFNSLGVPTYLIQPRDAISSELLSFISASLPESKPVPTYHPQFLSGNAESNLIVEALADVWMTFVHEGAGYRNVLGFYTYPTGNPPKTKADIAKILVAFPNASFKGSGGDLRSGDKVYLGRFEAGTTIGFAMLADGWDGSISGGIHQVFSDKHLNPETDPSLQAHTVLLWDDKNELFLVGFEDMNRMKGSDDDFNDAVFYLKANPVEAINIDNVKPIDKPQDTDGDGVNDTYDEFPTDPTLAYAYVYPAENSFGTFAFEDQWPGFGDYDFNDLVVDYQYTQYANGTNKLVRLGSKFIIKGIGAGFNNGFGIQLDVAPNQVASVSGSDLGTGLFSIASNGVENNQSKAVFIASDDVHRNFNTQGFVNTSQDLPFLTPDTILVTVNFASPLSFSAISSAPFNPFLVINQTRGREVHLPGYKPTDLVDTSYFGQGDDASSVESNVYYKSQSGLPWGMNLPVSFDYPKEKSDIRDTYLHFSTWAGSGGFTYMDWYTNKAGYRNTEKIYTR